MTSWMRAGCLGAAVLCADRTFLCHSRVCKACFLLLWVVLSGNAPMPSYGTLKLPLKRRCHLTLTCTLLHVTGAAASSDTVASTSFCCINCHNKWCLVRVTHTHTTFSSM